MLNKRIMLTYSIFAVCAVALAVRGADRPSSAADMAARRVSRLTQILTLTSAQQAQATTIFTNEANSMAATRSSMETAHKDLETAVEANDSSAIATISTQIGTLTTQEVQARATAAAAFYALLTADQQAKYKAMDASHPGPGRMRGPGPGGPPPFED